MARAPALRFVVVAVCVWQCGHINVAGSGPNIVSLFFFWGGGVLILRTLFHDSAKSSRADFHKEKRKERENSKSRSIPLCGEKKYKRRILLFRMMDSRNVFN